MEAPELSEFEQTFLWPDPRTKDENEEERVRYLLLLSLWPVKIRLFLFPVPPPNNMIRISEGHSLHAVVNQYFHTDMVSLLDAKKWVLRIHLDEEEFVRRSFDFGFTDLKEAADVPRL